MSIDQGKALIARAGEGKSYTVGVETLTLTDWPEGVPIRVAHSALNYKDALAITGRAPIIRNFPMVLGIDLAGEVLEDSGRFKAGERVLVNGWGLSETRWGAYSQLVRMPDEIVQPLPAGFSTEQAMQIGTAGYTAMLCVMALDDHGLQPGRDAVLVTGASGGVGSVAVSLLARRGYHVIAVSGRPEQAGFLQELGAAEVLSRDAISSGGRPMAKERWAGVVDVAGGPMLADAIAQTRYDGIVAACGMAGGGSLATTVYPFILRGVTLRGVDSVMVPMARREAAWARLEAELDRGLLARLSSTRQFDELPTLGADLLDGRLHGRIAIAL
jgi:acrylyl-CoA reductase (NADPH)